MESRINRKDRVLLENLENKYGAEIIANAIMNAVVPDEEIVEMVPTTIEPHDVILDYIMRLEGYRIRLRELHWQAEKKSEHELTDSLISDLESYEDAIAEDFMGIVNYRIKVGMLTPKMPKSTALKPLLDEIVAYTIKTKDFVIDNPVYAGMVTLFDDAIDMLNKSKYLETLC